MSKIRVNQIETLDGLNTKDVATLIDDINNAAVTTSIGTQALAEALDSRVIYVDTIADLQALPVGELVDGQQVQVKEYHAGTGVGGGRFYWDSSRTAENNGGTVIDGWVRVRSGFLTIEDFGAREDVDIAPQLSAALQNRENFGSVGGREYICSGVSESLRVTGVDLGEMTLDFRGTKIKKTGAFGTFFIRTDGVERFRVKNLVIDGDNLTAVGWQHRSFRQDFTGFVVFDSCEAYNLRQEVNGGGGQAAGFYVEGGMAAALFDNLIIDGVSAEPTLAQPITRGVLSRSIFELNGEDGKDFPLLTVVRGSKISNILDDRDADGVYGEVSDSSDGRTRSTLVVRDNHFITCKKRSVKSKYAKNYIFGNTFQHNVAAPTGPGRQEVAIQSGGGTVSDNTFIYQASARVLLYAGASNNDDDFPTYFINNTIIGASSAANMPAVLAGDLQGSATRHPGITVLGNSAKGFAQRNWVTIRGGSAPIGHETMGEVRVNDNHGEINEALIRLDRGPALGIGADEFYGLIRSLSARGNNCLSSFVAPLIFEQSTNISFTPLDIGSNGNISSEGTLGDEVTGSIVNNGNVITHHFPINESGQRADTTLTFNAPIVSQSGVASIEVSAVASSAGGSTRISYWKGYAHYDSGTLTVYPVDSVSDGNTGGFTVSSPSSNTVRVTKAAGALSNFIAGHVTITVSTR